MGDRESWLNGWHRSNHTVIVGAGMHCAGCGKFYGLTCVVIDPNDTRPKSDPNWPFEEQNCPICMYEHDYEERIEGLTADQLSKLPVSKLRQALIKAKSVLTRQEQNR